jgi:hypothetical protein
MKRVLTVAALVVLCAAPAGADVTITQTITVEGGMAAMAAGMMPHMVTRIKGMASRMDVDTKGQSLVTIMDLATKQLIVLNSATRTAQIMTPGATAVPGAPVTLPKFDMTVKSTGRSRVIEGAQCEEHAFTMAMSMAEIGASASMPPEAAAAMKDVRMAMTGSLWIATSGPGVADYVRFQKAATDANMVAAFTGVAPGQQAVGLDQLFAASSAAAGLPYLTEMTMTFEGTGKMVDMMKAMGPIRMTHQISSVSTDPIPDAMFELPEGYTVEKQ